MANYGVIDLGSNTIRLVIYQVKEPRAQAAKRGNFRKLIDDKEIAGLSSYVIDGEFTSEGVTKASEVLTEQLDEASYFNCHRIDIFATAVLRNCVNSSAVIRQIEDNINARINLLSAREEAHLGYVGASFGTGMKEGTLIDIGGGSTELTSVKDGRDREGLSLGMGCVSGFAQLVKLVLPSPEEVRTIREVFKEHLSTVADLERFHAKELYGIGGSARAASKIFSVAFLDGATKPRIMGVDDVDRVLALLEDDPSVFAHAAAKAVPERLHSCVPGIVILQTLLHELGGETLELCRLGLREGYLMERML